jgi:MFS transporter, DHA2 family, methylenomycin A resistance protein
MRTMSVDLRQPAGSTASRANLATSLTLAAMSLGYGVVQLDVTIVNTALTSIGSSFGGGVTQLQWVVSTYTIAFAAFILTAGALGDRIGAKKVFVVGFVIFTAASLACALAPTVAILIASRAVQGLGAAVLIPNSLALLNHAYPDERQRGRAVAIWAAGASLALTAGPLVGGALIALVDWRAIFLVNLPIGIAGLWLTLRYASETPRSTKREIDARGQIAAILALGLLAGALIEAGGKGWGSAWVIAGFALAAAFAVLFILQELHTAQPMLPLSLFKHRMFTLTSLVGLLVNVAFYGLIFVFSLYFQSVNGWSPLGTGLAFVPMMAVVLPANLIAPYLAERIGPRITIAAGAALSALGCFSLLGIEGGTGYVAICAQLIAVGAGLGLLVPPLTSALLGSVEKSRSGLAAGVLNSTRQTGSVLGVALFGSLVEQSGAFVAGARTSLIISAILLVIAGIAILFGASPARDDEVASGTARPR